MSRLAMVMLIRSLVVILALLISCCKSNSESYTELLASNNYTCWDAAIGFGMCFCRDGKLYEYEFSDQLKNKRVKADYGDVILRDLKWKIKTDSLIISSGSFKESYKIKNLTNQRLVLLNTNSTRGAKELVYTRVNTFVLIGGLKQNGAYHSQ